MKLQVGDIIKNVCTGGVFTVDSFRYDTGAVLVTEHPNTIAFEVTKQSIDEGKWEYVETVENSAKKYAMRGTAVDKIPERAVPRYSEAGEYQGLQKEVEQKLELHQVVDKKLPINIAYEGNATRSVMSERYDLIPQEAIKALGRRLSLGAVRHGENNWKSGGPEFIKATINHLYKHLGDYAENGNNSDLNTDAIICNAAFLCYFEAQNPRKKQ